MSNSQTASVAPVLHREELLDAASTQTCFGDFGDIPFLEPLDVLIESMNREAKLEGPRFEQARNMIISMLTKRLALVDDRKKYPEIANEVITAPRTHGHPRWRAFPNVLGDGCSIASPRGTQLRHRRTNCPDPSHG
jgi:hypothetical protein